jgi:hypothetical protein
MKQIASVTLLMLVLLPGCAPHNPLPAVHVGNDRDAMRVLAERADAVKTVSSQGTITLTRPDGESVRLDVAMVRAGREKLRLRAWKLGRAVFDLTVNGGDVWLLTPDDLSMKDKGQSAGLGAKKLAENINLLNGDLFHQSDATVVAAGSLLRISAPQGDGVVCCEVDRRTLVPLKYVLNDPSGAARFTLELSDYRMPASDVPFPFRMKATSEQGTIDVAMREVEINGGELALGAFVPPKRAEKLP